MAATKNPFARLGHIRDEIESITGALRGVEHDTFTGNYLLRRAAERTLLIISEAARALPKDLTDRYPAIDWRRAWVGRRVAPRLRARRSRYVMGDSLRKTAQLAPVIERMIDDLEQ
jgi:Ribonuclease HepT-like